MADVRLLKGYLFRKILLKGSKGVSDITLEEQKQERMLLKG